MLLLKSAKTIWLTLNYLTHMNWKKKMKLIVLVPNLSENRQDSIKDPLKNGSSPFNPKYLLFQMEILYSCNAKWCTSYTDLASAPAKVILEPTFWPIYQSVQEPPSTKVGLSSVQNYMTHLYTRTPWKYTLTHILEISNKPLPWP